MKYEHTNQLLHLADNVARRIKFNHFANVGKMVANELGTYYAH